MVVVVVDLSVAGTLRSLNICVCSAGSEGETAQPGQASPAVLQSERKSLNKTRNRTGYTDPSLVWLMYWSFRGKLDRDY